MKQYAKILVFAVLAVSVAGASFAGQTLKKYKGVQGRSYHADLYTGDGCASCHSSKKPQQFPAADACLQCHDLDDLVAGSARPEGEEWQNPHNNLHYGKDVPCLECHAEHETRQPLCSECHTFKFPKHKS